MRVAIVGGNSQVGIELALLLRADGHEVVPVVRNRQATAFLGDNGFDCRIADASDGGEMRRALDGADAVVVAAYAGVGSRDVVDYKDAWRTNKAIVHNSVHRSPADATVVYFSSIAAFRNDLYDSAIRGRFDHYGTSKRFLERRTMKAARRASKAAYVFRLGHVFGPSQPNAERFRAAAADAGELVVEADPDADSNVVHTVVIKEAIERCARNGADPGRFTLVNGPQWTWGDLFEHYAPPSTTVRFAGGEPSGGPLSRAVGRLGGIVADHRMKLVPLQVLLPDRLNKRVVYEFKKRRAQRRIADEPERFVTHEFEYESVPGPFLTGLPPAEDLLSEERAVRDAFAPDG